MPEIIDSIPTISKASSDFLPNFLRLLCLENGNTLAFMAVCALMGAIVVTGDLVSYSIKKGDKKRKSLLSLKYSDWKASLRNYFLWGLGSGIIGYLTCIIHMFQNNPQSCLAIAIIWPAIFVKVIESKGEPEIEQP